MPRQQRVKLKPVFRELETSSGKVKWFSEGQNRNQLASLHLDSRVQTIDSSIHHKKRSGRTVNNLKSITKHKHQK